MRKLSVKDFQFILTKIGELDVRNVAAVLSVNKKIINSVTSTFSRHEVKMVIHMKTGESQLITAAYYKDKFGEIATYLGSSSNESKQIHDASAGYKIYDNTEELNQYLDGIKMILQNADRQVNLRYKK